MIRYQDIFNSKNYNGIKLTEPVLDNIRDSMFCYYAQDHNEVDSNIVIDALLQGSELPILFIDGADNVGKTTLINKLKEVLPNTEFKKLPDDKNEVTGNLRDIVKFNETLSDSFRQALHTINHIESFIDCKDEVEYKSSLAIFDRSPLSTYVYSKLLGLDDDVIKILLNINFNFLKKLFNTKIFYFINLIADSPFSEKDNSYYEKNIKWEDINNLYSSSFNDIKDYIENFPSRFKYIELKISKDMSTNKIVKILFKKLWGVDCE